MPIIIVPENASISDILVRMNREQTHLAIVADEYGGTAGLLTMEDIIEELIGETSDEHDMKREKVKQLDENTYEFDGMIDLESVSEITNIKFDDDEQAVTLGGMVFNIVGRTPVVGDIVESDGFHIEVLEMDNNRIHKLLCKKIKNEEGAEEQPSN